MLATAAKAVVFVFSRYVFAETTRYVQYCVDRGYKPLGVIKGDLSVALDMLDEDKIQVIVFASRERQITDDEGPTRRMPDCVSASARPVNELRLHPRPADVRRSIENTGPIPTGLDPESIRAARRIWRHFTKHGCA